MRNERHDEVRSYERIAGFQTVRKWSSSKGLYAFRGKLNNGKLRERRKPPVKMHGSERHCSCVPQRHRWNACGSWVRCRLG